MFVPLLPRFFASPSFALCVRNLTTSASANMLTVREALHQALDEDQAFQHEVLNVARALGNAVKLNRVGKYQEPGNGLADPNPK